MEQTSNHSPTMDRKRIVAGYALILYMFILSCLIDMATPIRKAVWAGLSLVAIGIAVRAFNDYVDNRERGNSGVLIESTLA